VTLNYRSKKYMEMTPAERKEYDLRCSKRPPTTELQRLAQKENYALFQLAGIIGQLNSLNGLMDAYISSRVLNIRQNVSGIRSQIKYRQSLRKEQRKLK
jgi:hypothetical protein